MVKRKFSNTISKLRKIRYNRNRRIYKEKVIPIRKKHKINLTEQRGLKMKLGLALAGGGVKGAAHIGVIKALEDNHITIDAIGGTSIGSIVATLYAMGYSTEKMLEIFHFFAKEIMKANPKHVVNNVRRTRRILGYGLLSGESIEIAVRECAKAKNIKDIADIKMPLVIPTVDILNSKEYVFTNARKIDENHLNNIAIETAVRASCSYPVVFEPCEYNGHQFVDGGILNNLPAKEVRNLGVDKVLSVKFSAGLNFKPKNAYDIAFKAADILFDNRSGEAVKESDYTLELDLSEASVFNIKKIDYCYNIGYITTISKMKEIKKILNEEEEKYGEKE